MEPVNSCTRRPLDDRLRCRLTAVDGRRYWRAGWHILLAGALFALIDVLEGRGIAWRTAAQHGDPVARAGREWVRTFVGHRDALSVLEHAMTGFGAALLGVVALQLYYAQLAVETRRRTVGPLGRAIALLVAGTLGIGMGQVSHTGTQIRIGVFMAGAVWVTFVFRDLWRQLACDAPQWNIGWVGGVGVRRRCVEDVSRFRHAGPTGDRGGATGRGLGAAGPHLLGCRVADAADPMAAPHTKRRTVTCACP